MTYIGKSDDIKYPDATRRNLRIEELKQELAALQQNKTHDNSIDYIKKQFCYMFGEDRFDKDSWLTDIRSARISVYTDGNLYRPDTYYTLELTTSDVVILYEYERINQFEESWQVFLRLPDDTKWFKINNMDIINDTGTDFERELLYTLLNIPPSPGFEFVSANSITLPELNTFVSRIITNQASDPNDDNMNIYSLLD